MSYCLATCDVPSPPYAVCQLAGPVDFSTFDVDLSATKDQFLEVIFDVVSASVSGKLNLYYGQDPRRKYVSLVARGEKIRAGRYYKYFAPNEAYFPSWPPIPAACGDQCGPCPDIFQDGASGSAAFVAAIRAADLTLAAEGCSEAVDAQVRIVSVKLVNRTCGCATNVQCTSNPDRPLCRDPQSGQGRCGWPGTLLPRVCGPVAECSSEIEAGTACSMYVGGTMCSGTWQCENGKLACEVSSCGGG